MLVTIIILQSLILVVLMGIAGKLNEIREMLRLIKAV